MSNDPAVTATVEALMATEALNLLDHRECGIAAEVAVAAARPIIEAEVRERIAADIEANCRHMNHENRRLCHRCVAAARIARKAENA